MFVQPLWYLFDFLFASVSVYRQRPSVSSYHQLYLTNTLAPHVFTFIRKKLFMNKSYWAAAVAATTKESKYNSKEEKACLLLQFVLEINPGGPHMQNELLPIAVYSHTTQNLVCIICFRDKLIWCVLPIAFSPISSSSPTTNLNCVVHDMNTSHF